MAHDSKKAAKSKAIGTGTTQAKTHVTGTLGDSGALGDTGTLGDSGALDGSGALGDIFDANNFAANDWTSDELVAKEFAADQFANESDYELYRNFKDPFAPLMPSAELLAQTEVGGPPWDLSLIEGIELPVEGGIPMDTNRHRAQINLAIESTHCLMRQRGRRRYFVWGDMFIYYSPQQAAYVATHSPRKNRTFMGPDYFFMRDGDPGEQLDSINVWDHDPPRYPDVIFELLSPSTARMDKTVKKDRYEQIFQTPEYYLYKPGARTFTAYHLRRLPTEPNNDNHSDSEYRYQDVSPPDPEAEKARKRRGKDRPREIVRGRVWSEVLGVWIGLWEGTYSEMSTTWLRFFETEPDPVPIAVENELRAAAEQQAEAERTQRRAAEQQAETAQKQAEAAQKQAEAERDQREAAEQRAKAAQAELARLRALLRQRE